MQQDLVEIFEKIFFQRVESYSLQEFDKIGASSLITRTTNDITQIQQVLVIMLRMMISAPMMCIGGIIMAVSKDAKLSLVIIVGKPYTTCYINMLCIGKKGMAIYLEMMQLKIDKLNLILRKMLTVIRVIRSC